MTNRFRLSICGIACGLMALLSVFAGCSNAPNAPAIPIPAAKYFVSVDTLRTEVYSSFQLSMRSSNPAWHASKFVWDFGDALSLISRHDTTITHDYYKPGIFKITVIAFDSTNEVIAQAFSTAVVGTPTGQVQIAERNYTITSEDPFKFSAKVLSGRPDTFQWDFGDGVTQQTDEEVCHGYASSGDYTLRLTATNMGYVVSRDSVVVHVTLPVAEPENCFHMPHVTALFDGWQTHVEINHLLENADGYSIDVVGRTFTSQYRKSAHADNGVGSVFDTLYRNLLSGTLSQSGRYLLKTQCNKWDSSGYATPTQTGFHREHYVFPADSLKLVRLTTDSVVFTTLPYFIFGLTADNRTVSKIKDTTCSGSTYGPCMDYTVPIPPEMGRVTIIFWRKE